MTKREIYNYLQRDVDFYRGKSGNYDERATKYTGVDTEEEYFLIGLSTAYSSIANDLESFLEELLPDVQEK